MPSEGEKNLQHILAGLDVFLFISDTDGNILFSNGSAEKSLDYTHEEIGQKKIFELFPEDKRSEAGKAFTDILEGKSESYEGSLITKAGDSIPTATKINKIEWGGKEALICTVHNISERVKNLERLQECEIKLERERKKLETTMENIGGGVLVLDMNKKIIMVNDEVLRLSGFNREELLRTGYNEKLKFIDERTKEKTTSFIDEVYKKGETTQTTYYTELVGKDGSPIPVDDFITPTKNGKGDVIGSVITFRNVTREREYDRMKSDFVSIAAHQLRTPLGSMRWNLEMLLSGEVDPVSKKVAEILYQIYESNQRLTKLVNYLLNISQIEQGAVSDKPEPIQLEEIIQQVINEHNSLAQGKGIEIKPIKSDPLTPKVYLDQKKVYEVLSNLVANSIKYTKREEQGVLEVSIAVYDTNIVIAVSDNGMGIPVRDQPKIFSRFFRGEKATKREAQGTGLGLFVVKSYVESWGGKVWFDSREKEGTTFYVSVPTDKIYANRINKSHTEQ